MGNLCFEKQTLAYLKFLKLNYDFTEICLKPQREITNRNPPTIYKCSAFTWVLSAQMLPRNKFHS